jgi:hypothetical protein
VFYPEDEGNRLLQTLIATYEIKISCTLKMEALHFSETLVTTYKTTSYSTMKLGALDSTEMLVITDEAMQWHNREDHRLNFHRLGNVESHSSH